MEIVDLSTLPDSEVRYTEFLRQICEKHDMDHAAYAGMNPAAGTVAVWAAQKVEIVTVALT